MTEARSSWHLLGLRQIMNEDRPIVDSPWWTECGSCHLHKNGGDDGDEDDDVDDDDDDDDDDVDDDGDEDDDVDDDDDDDDDF